MAALLGQASGTYGKIGRRRHGRPWSSLAPQKIDWIWLIAGQDALNQKIPCIRQGREVGQQEGTAVDIGQVNRHPVIARGHADILNTLNPERGQIHLVGPTGEIRHGIRPVTGTEHEHVIAGTTCQPVITRPADKGVVPLPAENPVIAVAAGHHIIPAARATVQGVVACATVEVVVAAVAGQDVVVGAANEVLHIGQRFALLCAAPSV